MRTIVRVRPTDSQAAFVIGADSSCVAELKSTSDGGGTWGSASTVGSAWFRDPRNQRVATSCLATPVPKDLGQIALSLVDGGGWLAVGDTTMRSTDGLLSWSLS